MPATLATTVMQSTNASQAAQAWDAFLAELLGTDLKFVVNGAAPLAFGIVTPPPTSGTVGPLMESMASWAAINAMELLVLAPTYLAATLPLLVAAVPGLVVTGPGLPALGLKATILAAGLSAYTQGTPLDAVMNSWAKTIVWPITVSGVVGAMVLV